DGVSCKMIVAFTGNDQIGLACWLEKCDVQQPMRKFSTTLGGTTTPVSIQLPEVRTIRLQQTAQLRPDSCIVIAATQADGRWLVPLLQATAQKKGSRRGAGADPPAGGPDDRPPRVRTRRRRRDCRGYRHRDCAEDAVARRPVAPAAGDRGARAAA